MTLLSCRAQTLRFGLLAASVFLAFPALAAGNPAQEKACQSLQAAGISNVVIEKSEYLVAGDAGVDTQSAMTGASGNNNYYPARCRVRGVIEPRSGQGGQNFGTHFELNLPDNWQRRFIFQGGGGLDGFLAPAVGSIPVRQSTATPALARGYAVVSMDGGHQGMGPEFATDQQARLDYGYAAIGKVTAQAKRLIALYYNSLPKHSYFMGCSNGGREAMLAAQRYPSEFDGIVAGNAGFRLSRAAIGEAWDNQVFMSIAPKDASGQPVFSQAFSEADLKLVSQGVLKACDKLDGLEDGLINNYPACHFKPESLRCASGKQADCLSAPQVDALAKIFGGAKNARGEQVYSDWPYDAGISASDWRGWKLGSSLDPKKPDARNITLGGGSLKMYFMTPPAPDMDLFKFDFDRDVARVAETSALNDAVSSYMTSFEGRGGKMIIFHGLSDPVFSANDIMRWYQTLQSNTDAGDAAKLRQWARLFMVPGMTHCGGGPALDNFDPLGAIENWVERGQAPAFLAAKGSNFPGKEQPLCPYPQSAKYLGGDVSKLSSYQCVDKQ